MLPKIRPYIYGLRVISAVLLVLGAWIGWNYISNGEAVTGFRLIISAVAFALAAWVSPYSPLFLVLLAIPILILPFTRGAGFVFAMIAAIALLWLAWQRVQPVSIDPAGVKRAPDDAVMPHAQKFVSEFEALRWSRAGAVSAELGQIEVTLAVLLSPDRRSYAEVTDVVVAITSSFAHGRTFVSRNSAASPMSPWVLANDRRGDTPTQLVTSHQEVLEILKGRNLKPLTFDPATLIEFVIEQEKRSIEESTGFKPRLSDTAKGMGPIDRSEDSAERIRRWSHTTGPDFSGQLTESDQD
jgi:hypothetical protein